MTANGKSYEMRLRSSVSAEEKEQIKNKRLQKEQERLNKVPIVFEGKIFFAEEFIDIAKACDDMLNFTEASDDIVVLGFDIEWPFSFHSGSGKTALIQISPNLEKCYLFYCSMLQKLPKALNCLLAHPKTRITGVNIKNDIRKLVRDFPGLESEKIIENCIDSGNLANKVLPFQQRWSMEKLVGYVLKMSINKDKKVRMSKWNIIPYSEEQKQYAATDAYVSLLLYLELKKREKQQLHEAV